MEGESSPLAGMVSFLDDSSVLGKVESATLAQSVQAASHARL